MRRVLDLLPRLRAARPQTTCHPHWRAVERSCKGGCDPAPASLEAAPVTPEENQLRQKPQAHTTRQASHWAAFADAAAGAANVSWQAFQGALPAAELASLSLLEIKIDYATRRGGSASITSQQKKSLTRAVWKASDVEGQLPSPGAPGLQLPLRAQPFYRALLARHRGLLAEHRASADQSWRGVPAAELLLNLPGVEVAARPWLYPSMAFGDTDISLRLKATGHLDVTAAPSPKAHWMRKLLSGCEDFRRDYHLQALLYNVCGGSRGRRQWSGARRSREWPPSSWR
ncbi:unnamed protein product [Effrenium voratum]|uniref:Uncharacterized protein n=1 Tax=Effrenium voratum TaxID=2562239 RepID=A0AA36IE68_9DINO|nr:unnamed protein product [Effrenium voratum]